MLNIGQATDWLRQNETIQFKDGTFVKPTLQEKFCAFFKKHDLEEVKKITAFVLDRLQQTRGEAKTEYLKLASALIGYHKNNWHGQNILKVFDRIVAFYRPKIHFEHPLNKAMYQKWVNYGMPSEIYLKYPEFCNFLEKSGLLSQMKVTKDTIFDVDGQPAILVEGELMTWPRFKEQFESVYSRNFRETFLVRKSTSEVYTYLDNGKGLEKHHPYLSNFDSISHLNDEDYQKILAKGREFIRPEEAHLSQNERDKLNESRTFVMQVVLACKKGPDTRVHNMLLKPHHLWTRVVIGEDDKIKNLKKGDVCEAGYVPRSPLSAPFASGQGRFRSPDIVEYKTGEEIFVTNVAVSEDEAKAFYDYTSKYHLMGINIGNPLAFHYIRQNCTVFGRRGFSVAGIDIPTEISLSELIHAVSPLWMAKIGDFFKLAATKTSQGWRYMVSKLPEGFSNCVRSTVEKIQLVVRHLFEAPFALSLVPVNLILGAGHGKGGEAFVAPGAAPERVEPILSDWRRWLTLSSYRFNLPGVIREWQLKQPSTVAYRNQVKLTIVPN